MKILITGSCGFIGSILCQKLVTYSNYEIVGIDNLFYNNSYALQHLLGFKNFQFHRLDARDLPTSLIKNTDIIIPLAALVGAPICKLHPQTSYETNIDAIKSLIKRVSKYQRIISPCTNSGYGVGGDSLCDETSPLLPVSEYGKQKVEAEKIILDHPNSVSLRLATVFGVSPRMRFDLLVNDFVRKLYFTNKISMYEPHFKRNAVHIHDVCRAITWMIDPLYTGIFNVGNDECNLTKRDFADRIINKLGRGELFITDGKDEDQRDYIVSNAKILRTGFKFKYSLDDGINELITLCNNINLNDTFKMSNV
jgi:nucleoside-diphosphate-sugar epimerase